MKKTAIAHSNIAFIKYWGKKDELLKLPENSSISMNLSNMYTTTTVEFNSQLKNDTVLFDGQTDRNVTHRVSEHLDRIRKIAKSTHFANVVTQNTFPSDTGLSSSASGFAALTLASLQALGVRKSAKELSIISRLGSGSACRSIPDGFVQWLESDQSDESYAYSLYPPSYWGIADIVAIVSTGKKDIPTTTGMVTTQTSPFWPLRKQLLPQKIEKIKTYLKIRDFEKFGELVESEALEMHAIMLTSKPSLIYWQSGTLEVMKNVKKWRDEGISCYFTINTGQDVHILCQKKDVDVVVSKLATLSLLQKTIINWPSRGSYLTNAHLF